MAVIELDGLTKRFGSTLAVDHLSFAVQAGQVVGFLGPNGAGKTTTLRMLLGLVTPTEGQARICGRPYRELEEPLRRVGAVLESSGAHPGRTARAHLRLQALASGSAPARVEEMLDLVGLTRAAGRRVGAFSLGMRQRLGLAAALLADPEVLILDEPANGLDPEGVRWLRGLLRAQAEGGRTVLVSSHILAEVAQSVDSVVILDQGRLASHSSLEGLSSSNLERAFLQLTSAEGEGPATAEGPPDPPAPVPAAEDARPPGTPPPAWLWLLAPLALAAVSLAFLLGRRTRREPREVWS